MTDAPRAPPTRRLRLHTAATREALNWNLAATRAELGRLIAGGVMGPYRSVEVTEMFGWRRGEAPFNLLSVLVLEETSSDDAGAGPRILNGEPIRLKGLKALAFGIRRFAIPIVRLDEILERYEQSGVWAPAEEALQVGELKAQRPEFAPSDGTVSVPLNGVLKNNFWAGSHLFHLACAAQEGVQPLLDDPRRLQALSEAISPFVPWRLAGLSDLLGDILIQLPVLSVTADVSFDPEACALDVDLTWQSPNDLAADSRF